LTAAELARLLADRLPAIDLHGVIIEEAEDQDIRLRFPFRDEYLGPNDIFSGPTLLGFADTAIYAAGQAALGADSVPLVSTMSATFIRPAQAADVVTISRVIRRGKRLLNAEAWLFSHTPIDPILHATATCVVKAWR
jgi:uncharacterized protein (TIGR00369 family)